MLLRKGLQLSLQLMQQSYFQSSQGVEAGRQSLPFEAAAVNINKAKRTPGVTSTAANRRENFSAHIFSLSKLSSAMTSFSWNIQRNIA